MVSKQVKFLLLIIQRMGFLKQQTKLEKFLITLSVIFLIISIVLIWMFLLFNEMNVESISIVVIGTSSFSEILTGAFSFIMHKEEFLELLNMQDMFWIYSDDNIARKKQKIDRLFKIVINMEFGMVALTIFTQASATFSGTPSFICYIPGDNQILSIVIGCIQLFIILHVTFPIVALDFIAAIVVTELYLQMEQLNITFSNMKNLADIKKCVRYYIFLNKCIRCFQKCMDVMMFVAYFATMCVCCTQLNLLANYKINFSTAIKCVCFMLGMLFQFGLYCIPVSLLKDAHENLSQSIANCDLILNGDKNLKVCLIIMMKMVQKELSIKAGGLVEMNRAAYITMLKSTYSFYTLMSQNSS